MALGTLFQFHKGTIKTMMAACDTMSISHFNSIKVRLKRIGGFTINSSYIFQFHKGTIKTICFVSLLSFQSHFNSIKVRLKLFDISPMKYQVP